MDTAPLDFPAVLGAEVADAAADASTEDAAAAAVETAAMTGLIESEGFDIVCPFGASLAVATAKEVGLAAKSFGMTKGASPAFPKSTLPVVSITSGLAAKKLRVNLNSI